MSGVLKNGAQTTTTQLKISSGGGEGEGEADSIHEPSDALLQATAIGVEGDIEKRVGAALPLPWRPTMPKTATQQVDRHPYTGVEGLITCAEVCSGVELFADIAESLGLRCTWVADADEVAVSARASGRRNFGDYTRCHPDDLPDVFILIGGTECRPFSAAGLKHGLMDDRTDTLLWVIWALARRQWPVAFLENVANIINTNLGNDWLVILQMFDMAGYVVFYQLDCASHWNYDQTRKRVFITAMRKDLARVWGAPPPVTKEPAPGKGLCDTLFPWDHPEVQKEVIDFASALAEEGCSEADFVWRDGFELLTSEQTHIQPVSVAKINGGGYGNEAFVHATPAHKSFSGGL